MKPSSRGAIFVACLVLSTASLVNVFADNADVTARARLMGCAEPGPCGMTHMERSPFAQTFDFTTKSKTTTVRCARSAIFFGDYSCEKR